MANEELQKSYYAIIPANVRYDKDLTPNAKLLYGEITALCNDRGYCWATNDYFSNLYGVSKTSISKWVNNLVQKGYISSELIYKEGTKQIENRYLRIVTEPIEEKLNSPIEDKLNSPIEDKLIDNNTKTFNNTFLNNTNNKEATERNKTEVISYEEIAFNEFWSAYPKKVNKKGCYKSFCKIKNLKAEMPLIMEALERFKASKGWLKDNGQFIPYPLTFINQRRWEDEQIETREDKLKNISMDGWL